MNETIRAVWSRSKPYRVFLILALVYAGLRLIFHGVYMAILLVPDLGLLDLPGWSGANGNPIVPIDLQVYLDAAEALLEQGPLYDMQGRIEFYQYAPAYALVFLPFLPLPAWVTVALHSLIHIAAYVGLAVTWDRIFRKLGLVGARRALAVSLPVWLIFTSFWSDLGYLNVYIPVALLGALLVEAIVDERLGWSVFWLSLILQSKPHWAFAIAVPLLLGRTRFFFRLMGLAAVVYAGIVGATMLVVGPAYTLQQYGAYVRFLATMADTFRWHGPEAAYLGYNHAIKQIVYYLFGVTPGATRIATAVKALALAPLALIGLRSLRAPVRRPPHAVPQMALDLAFATYLGAFIWLDWVWEVSLSPAIFAYLLGTVTQSRLKAVVWSVFLPYATIDVVRLVSFATLGMDAIAPGLFVLTDPSLYLPLMMIVILVFYGALIRRLWRPITLPQTTMTGVTDHGL